ncbi:MAG: 50S ribosomal protein L32 [Candidatus Staskawiczbacteria bacterium]|nr:50S ribosomal protein L32 [Candidatus Staskawiczbacteria bacterium]MBI3337380.1 50S ribosomal protein L32 [Candidatus Staskawiczbacteria bacterium]
MAVPKHRHTKSKRNKVRMHLYVKPAVLALCKKCKSKVLPYTVCQNCGYYKGQEIINVLSKLTKKEKKQREKEIKTTEKEEKSKSPVTMEELSRTRK